MIQSVLQKYGKRVLFPSILVIIGLLYFYFSNNDSSTPQEELIETIQPTEQPIPEQTIEPSETAVYVDVKGAVVHPGMYTLTNEDRVLDAVLLAGGYTSEADTKLINHAQKLQDEMILYIPIKGEKLEEIVEEFVQMPTTAGASGGTASSSGSADGKVNLNKADETTLMTLSGIGPSKAQSIIAYRDESGGFKTIEDLKNVTGIGDKTFEKLKEFITVK
ncbi:MAG: helix-hairpin-helix domain-containing protein [Lysinibacillus sp.]